MTADPPSAAATARDALRRAWTLRWRLLAIHAAFLLAGSAVLSPLAGLTVQGALQVSGEAALTDTDVVRFLLSPLGLVAGLAAAGIVAALAALELATMMAADLAPRGASRAPVLRAAATAVSRAPRIAVFAALLLLRLALIAAPFAAAAWLVVAPLLAAADVNYYLAERPPEAVRAALLLGLLAAALAGVLVERLSAWAAAPGALLAGEAGPRRAFALSAERLRGRRLGVALTLAVWALAAAAAGAAITGLSGAAARFALGLFDGGSLAQTSAALAATLGLWLAAGAVAGAGAAGVLAAYLARLHRTSGGAAPAEPRPVAEGGRRRGMLALAAAVAAAAVIGGGAMLDAAARGDAVEVIAHRGAAGARPENTLSAFEHAIAEGADWIELDVQETADGAVVVMHDRDFMKLAGRPLAVHEATREEIAAIDVGSWFSPDYADERAPTLREALDLARGRAKVLIELKHYGFAVRLEERVAEIVESLGMADQVAVMSLDRASVRRMRALRPDWRVGLLAAASVGDLTRTEGDFLALRAGAVSDALLTRARKAGKPVLVWTVNDALSMSAMISRGASGLITDEPGLARRVLEARAEMGAAERLMLAAADLFDLPRPVQAAGRDRSP